LAIFSRYQQQQEHDTGTSADEDKLAATTNNIRLCPDEVLKRGFSALNAYGPIKKFSVSSSSTTWNRSLRIK
jgi:hypothetical protein